MSETLLLKARGLARYSSPLSARPEGSLNSAVNITVDQPGVFTPRRGFERLPGYLSNPTNSTPAVLPATQAKGLIPFSDEMLVYAYETSGATNYLYKYVEASSTFVKYTGFSSALTAIRYAEAIGNLYVTGDTGVFKLSSVSGSFEEAGVPRALGGIGIPTTSGGFLDSGKSVSYEWLWGYKDSNNNLILGAPCNPVLVTSGGAASHVDLTIQIPDEIVLNKHFLQIYRTEVSDTSATGDTYFLLNEVYPTAGQLTAGSMDVADISPDDFLGSELYTNATREGVSQANLQAPKCTDITVFNNHMFYAGLTHRQTYDIQLLASGASAAQGIRNDDTVTISDLAVSFTETYTGKATETLASQQFLVSNTGSPAVDVRLTAESLVRCINYHSTKVYAYYDSTTEDLPGRIKIEERDFGGNAFNIVASTSTRVPFSPDISTTAKYSTADTFPNRLAISKLGEYEAVPGTNWLDVGNKTGEIKRVVALRDSLFIIKEDGIWRLTGTSVANFSIDAFDTSTKIIAPSSVVTLNNLIYGLFDQGVCTLSESGVSIISRDIEGDLRELLGLSRSNLVSLSHACSYETERSYLLWVPQSATDTYATLAYVYNTITAAWTTYNKPSNASVVNPYDDKMYIARGDALYLSRERKSFSFRDYVDEQIDVVAVSTADTVIALTSLSGVSVGDIYYQSSDKFAVITALDVGASTITVDTDLDFSTSQAKTFTAAVTDICTSANHYFNTGLEVRATTTTTLPAGLSLATSYYVYKIDANTFKLCATKNGSITGSDPVDITGTGTGTHTLTPQISPEVRTFYRSTIEWNAVHLNSPAHLKQFSEANFLTSKEFRSAVASFKTNLSASWASVTYTGNPIGLWGLFPWGSLPWGGEITTVLDHRTYVPRDKQRASVIYPRMVIDTAFTEWEMSGLEFTYRNAGARGTVK